MKRYKTTALRESATTRRQFLGAGTLLGTSALLASGCNGTAVTAGHQAASRTKSPWAAVQIVPIPQQAPADEGYVDLDDVRLWYWDTGGRGPVVVLSHPFTGSGASWLYQQPVFAKAGFRVIGYSRRGYYKSTAGAKNVRVAASVDLANLATALRIDRFHIVASAAGAIVAADFAVSYPQRVYSMVLASSILGVTDEMMSMASRALLPGSFHTMPPDFRELGPSYRAANPEGVKRWLEMESQARPGEPSRVASANSVSFEALVATRIPTLLLTGDADLYMPPALLQSVAQRMPNAQLAIIENAGHAAFWEQPEAFNGLVLDFLRRQPVPAL